jgi:two-component system OmpR family sensor kinase
MTARSRRRQLGVRSVVGAFATLTVVVLAAAAWGLHALAADQQARVDTAARAVPALYRAQRARGDAPADAVRDVAMTLARDGVRVFPFPPPGPSGGAFFPPPPPGGPGLVPLSLLGLHPVRVAVGDVGLLVGMDVGRFEAVATPIIFGALATIGVAALVLGFVLVSIRQAALQPLRQTTAALRRFARRDFTPERIEAGDDSLIGELASAYTAAAHVVAAAFDERRRAELEMQRFVVDAGHELRTPLSVLIGFVDVLQEGRLDDASSQRLYAAMRVETARMHRLIEGLITLARLNEPTVHEQGATVDVEALAGTVRDALAHVADDRTIAVRTLGPGAYVRGGENDVYDVLYHCVDNALKYGARSDVEIAIETLSDAVTVTVTDRGPGMSADERRQAFDRFYRGTQTRIVPGSGLGLAIVKRAVERLNGSVQLLGEEGRGTRVVLTLPRAPAVPQLEEY